jgi:VCBS repeat-containing protein
LYLYQQQANGTWALKSSNANYITTVLTIGTQTGGNVTYSNLGTGNYAVLLGTSTGVGVLPSTTVTTTSDITTLALTVAATVTGNLLTNDTSSVAGTVPNGTVVTQVTGNAIAATGNTVITSSYGTLTIDSHGNYTYTLKAGLDADLVPATDVFTYSVRDASGAVTSASLTVNLHNGASTSTLLATNSLVAEATNDHDASGSIYGSASGTHTGTLSITNEHGDITTVHSVGTTSIAGDFGVLSIAANGNYTYSLNAGVDGQSITHKEVFSYTLAASDGTITTQSFTIELHPTITGTTGADTLTGGAYDDTITSGAGADTLVYHLLASADATGGNGHDTWTDFNVAQGDKIDVSNLLIGWNDSTSNINDFVKVDHTSDGNTVLSIDRDGTGTGYSTTQLITLEGVNVSLEELLQQPHQNHTA